jgi:hypothetical protein
MIVAQLVNAPNFMITKAFYRHVTPTLPSAIPCTPISYISLEYVNFIQERFNLRNLRN